MRVELSFLCVALLLLSALLLLQRNARAWVGFGISGALCALVSAYINGFAALALTDNGSASLTVAQSVLQLTPIVEEAIKLIPLCFCLALRRSNRRLVLGVPLATGLGFAAVEAFFTLSQDGSALLATLPYAASAVAMHAVCGAMIGTGVGAILGNPYLLFPGILALLCAASTYHAIYNLLVTLPGIWRLFGFLLPWLTGIAFLYRIWRAKTRAGAAGN